MKKLFSRSVLASFAAVLFALSAMAAASPSATELLSAGRVDDAVRSLNQQVQSNPGDAQAYHLLSRAYFHLKKWDQSISYGEKAVQLSPNQSSYYMWLGRAYGEKADEANFLTAAGLTKKIRANFEKAVELDGNNVAARTDLAEFYIEAPGFMGGGTDRAAEQAQKIAPLDAAKADWVYARIAEKKKDAATAEREYFAAIKAAPTADNWLSLASFYRRQNRLEDMENAVNKAVSSDMKQSNSLYDAATLLLRAGRNLPGAAGYVRKYLSLPTQNEEAPAFEAHYVLGEILEKQGDKTAAADQYRASLALAGDYKPAREALRRTS
jgi:tetratricopeptide (TPR) repeat protein